MTLDEALAEFDGRAKFFAIVSSSYWTRRCYALFPWMPRSSCRLRGCNGEPSAQTMSRARNFRGCQLPSATSGVRIGGRSNSIISSFANERRRISSTPAQHTWGVIVIALKIREQSLNWIGNCQGQSGWLLVATQDGRSMPIIP